MQKEQSQKRLSSILAHVKQVNAHDIYVAAKKADDAEKTSYPQRVTFHGQPGN